MDFDKDQSLKEWAKDKPLSILQLDPADRAVLRIAAKECESFIYIRDFQLAARGPHVARYTIFVAREAFRVGPFGLDFCSFIMDWTPKMEHPPPSRQENPGYGPAPLCIWPAKYLSM
ncbi:hypothetical protein M8J77_023239 [Diaphorina citri]|nr:hypothetical protein M8J77_023239 [Diaphorina citri]